MSSLRPQRGSGPDDDESPSGITSVPHTYEPGDNIDDKYTLIRRIGEGGMGTVWVAHNNVLDVHCAIKLIDLGTSSRDVSQRLLDEARAAAKLGHAAIVRVLDYGETTRRDPFIAMELLDGEDLAMLMQRETRLDAIQAVQLLLPIAHALGTAHAKGIVHRDVKPENIFLAKDEVTTTQPKLLDFGIVRVEGAPRRLTLDGAVLGTPDYMSPEQARGTSTTGTTDLWSFCVVLFELIAGRRPFEGDNYNSLMRAIIEEQPPTLLELGVADEELSTIVNRGFFKDPVARWSTMRELGEELALWLESHGVSDDVTGATLKRTWLAQTESKRIELPPDVRMSLERTAQGPATGASTRQSVPSGSGIREAAIREARTIEAASGRHEVASASNPAIPVVAPSASVPDSPSEESLERIAALHTGGDPEELLERANRNRNMKTILLLVFLVIAGVLAVLIGTGIIVPGK
jgi:eukaryotic-like serine/threonine-protein kinase